MREDSGVAFAIVYACLAPFLAAVDAVEAFWSARDDPTWETRWKSLPPDERSWLAVMATSRAWINKLADPEESRLAKGCRRRESRRRLNFDLIAMPILLATAVLALTGVISADGVLAFVFGGFATIRAIWIYRRERQIKGALEDRRKLAAATAS
jgi:hypothetical protein